MQSVGLQPVKKWDYGRLGLNFQTGMLFEDQQKYVDPGMCLTLKKQVLRIVNVLKM